MQSINLYQAEFQPDRSPLQLGHMLLLATGFILLLIVFSAWGLWGNHQLENQLQQLQDRRAQLTAERDSLAAASSGAASTELDRKLDQLRRDIAARKSLSSLLGDQSLGNSGGFSAQLQALAKASDSSFALHEFRLLQDGRYITMSGQTKSPAAVPAYLQKLERDQAFSLTRFGVLNLSPGENSFFAFSLGRPTQGEVKP
ncbi:hypothetical protein [Gilvimarinus sp. DA14]|uniref:hypothetical protein n=1 Tax=Gilvimarinus sp. DA14 TaxID=2956798 RepID=UPI0020B8304E|nr:hypothetical protein [Gilvimarinus sp. DA14]UTF61402.1 hypothetical protein NHM04_06290 [Gilvimarinus sp. DA14]